MNFDPTPTQQEIQQMARQFAQEEVAPLARETDESGEFPLHLVKRMGELGFLAATIDPAYGGSEMDYLSYTLISEELGRVDSSVRGFLAVHGSLVSLCIHDWGTEEQKRHYLPHLATGDWIGCYCLTEPNAGSDAASMESTAREDGDGYVINGEKIWITNGGIADIALVFASLDREKRHKGICAFIVPTNTPGFHREPMPGKELGHRSSSHSHITFQEMRVPKGALLGQPGEGFKVAMSALDHGRIGVAAGAVGIAQACLDASVDFARTRRQFGQRIGDFQMIQAAIADMSADIEAARLLVYKAAWLKEQGLPTTRHTATAKLFATEIAARAADQAVLIHGGRGYSNEYPVERFYRDIKGLQIYEGSSHIQRIVIAREVIGREAV
ncbi:MAG: acyl-CoA dehydrogenase [Chloroflexi bacterium]|nr:acyl-CoA dehydrogenase family protein [Ardenticatenaceae bacterium]MBL1130797.1 acyl-CoA dehydrogenase [Chloroflexota bacterium]NOG36893.1 acyl-CoA dehydrogenase [Chloroflexota bacterium]GIK58403.1 MAG: acyl-CoA dehydrogenase [Chloroflexota bacterium]